MIRIAEAIRPIQKIALLPNEWGTNDYLDGFTGTFQSRKRRPVWKYDIDGNPINEEGIADTWNLNADS